MAEQADARDFNVCFVKKTNYPKDRECLDRKLLSRSWLKRRRRKQNAVLTLQVSVETLHRLPKSARIGQRPSLDYNAYICGYGDIE